SIPALTCMPQGTALPGDSSNCSGGGTTRTDGDNLFPCLLRSRSTRDTYVCPLGLPTGAVIQEIIAYGQDSSSSGYMEAAVWRSPDNGVALDYFSSFGGVWQTTGLAAT